MMKMALALTLLTLVLISVIHGQNSQVAEVQRASSAAQQLAAAGNWAAARSTVETALETCKAGPEQSSCRQVGNFALAYLAQQQASAIARDNSERSQLFREARDFYKAVLVDAPNDGATLNNLALIEERLGDSANAAEHWRKAIDVDPARGGQYALRLGDLFLRQNQLAEARAQYRRSADLSPDAETPRRRLVETYRKASDLDLQDLPPFLFQAEASFPSLARTGYELLISRLYKQRPADADRSLLRWTIVTSQQGWLTEASLANLPGDWSAPSISELRRYMADPATSNQPWNWWRSRDDRRRVMIEVARTAGKQLLEREQVSAAAHCWAVALDSAKYIESEGPPVPAGAPPIGSSVTLREELALLYYQNPSLDPDRKKLDELVRELFLGKMEAYEHQRWPAIQEYHTVIGLIYAARGVWEPAPGQWRPASAIFQFENALKAAKHRKDEENFYQPLPEIKARLAQGYEITKRPTDAQKMYWLAALAYLDSDAPGDSMKMLESHRRIAGSSPDAKLLERVIRYRSQPVSTTNLTEANAPWLFRTSPLLSQDFLQRQRFKIYADQAGAAETALTASERLGHAWEAYKLAAEKGTSLVGAGDLVRWEKISAKLLEVGHVTPQAPRLLNGVELSASKGRMLRLALAGQNAPIGIPVSTETQSAASIVATLGPDNALLLGNYIQVRANQVFVRTEDVPSKVNILLQNLRNDRAIQVSPMATVPIA